MGWIVARLFMPGLCDYHQHYEYTLLGLLSGEGLRTPGDQRVEQHAASERGRARRGCAAHTDRQRQSRAAARAPRRRMNRAQRAGDETDVLTVVHLI
jgi:hypothetical protein